MSALGASRLSRDARHRAILDHLMTVESATLVDLAALADVSLMTIHRDVEDLSHRGIVRRSRGSVSVLPSSVFESSSEFRLQMQREAKNALARRAVEFVEPGMSVMLDDSTTVLALARLLNEIGPLTVVTNYRQAIEVLRENPEIRLLVVGGQYSRTHDSYIAMPGWESVGSYAVDIVFQSTSSMDSQMTYHQEQEIVFMKRSMLRSGGRRILLMDGSKVGKTSLHHYAPVRDFTDVVLTDDVAQELVEEMRRDTRVHLVQSR